MVELFCDSFGAVPKRILLDIDDTEDLVHGGSRCFNGEGEKVRRYGDFHYAAKSWTVERRVIARVEAGPQGADSRFIVTKLPGLPKSLYEKVYCARGQAENLIKAHKLYLASDRTSCHKATANQFRLLIHTAAYWLMLTLRGLASRTSFWREAQFNPIRLCLIVSIRRRPRCVAFRRRRGWRRFSNARARQASVKGVDPEPPVFDSSWADAGDKPFSPQAARIGALCQRHRAAARRHRAH